ncbi:D-alanine--D-alanine ligase family protein [Desulfurivibrio alkaliphilus]|uniref:D-alanine--D-alanine ligase n=1 Tax=Desulfurivibrio alkaliphilus (strain DSM 19089 / UNIQEM U267 / AHT2) TaxID=589865 RepID=D6Z524_DESAT|nr:D-alanine--D-alanine ligase [Desulfurivibrio alkaliphilus]ADH86649.1 D-alanine/D-alanine ligase [Desulfurivibrio alkaliphilus AHT 2]
MAKKEKLRVALLAGGKSGEREVSLAGAREVEKAINTERYDVRRYDPATDLARLVADAPQLDVAFILLHGPLGEDGSIQGLLDLLEIPYQGSGVLGSALAMDKDLAKQLYRHAGLLVPAWEMAGSADLDDPARLLQSLKLPLVVKPVRQGSSLGMSLVDQPAELVPALKLAFDFDDQVMVEEFIAGRELTGGVLGNADLTPLPVVEIIPGKEYRFFDYQAKYQAGATREICPAQLPAEVTAEVQRCACLAHQALNLRGYSRTDMILAEGGLYVLETNTIPGMTPTSLLPQAAATHGLSFGALLDRLLELALEGRGK